jgi:hypothetical protein
MESTMNFRLILLTSGLLTATALGGCNRDELAPWGFPQGLELECQDVPTATVGAAYDWTPTLSGGTAPFMWSAQGLPAGLTIDAETGRVTGTPTEEGTFEFTITVTDAEGETKTFTNCGSLVVNPPDNPEVMCIDDSGSIPDGFVGIDYAFEISAQGGTPPYTWSGENIPPGLTLVPSADTLTVSLEGTPTTKGTYDVRITATDSAGNAMPTDCGELIINDPLQVDTDELLMAFPDGCVPLGVSLAELQSEGIIINGDGSPISCELRAGRGMGSGDFDKDGNTDDTHPPGITLDQGSCTTQGALDTKLPYGIYAFITTFSQSGINAYVPYCAAQMSQPPTAYEIVREDTGTAATFKPGLQVLDPDEAVAYGSDVPDPRVTVTYNEQCMGSCFYAFVFAYNTLSGMSMVSANPNSKFPQVGFEGFTHAIRIADADPTLLDRFAGRAWVTNITFDYCMAQNNSDCGNDLNDPGMRAEKVRENGGGSNYYFSLVLLPAN